MRTLAGLSLVMVTLCIVSVGKATATSPMSLPEWEKGTLNPESESKPVLSADQAIGKLSDGLSLPYDTALLLSQVAEEERSKKLVGDYTIGQFLELNRATPASCSKLELKNRVEFCDKLDKGEPETIERNLYCYCRDNYHLAAGYCCDLIGKVDDSQLVDTDINNYFKNLKKKVVANSRYRDSVQAGHIGADVKDVLGEFIINDSKELSD